MTHCRFATPGLLLLVPLVGALMLAPPQTAEAAQPKESKDAVKITATADKPDADGKQNVTITIDILATWHLYANPVKNDMMTDSQTVVKFAANGKKLDDAVIKYPPGKEKKDAMVGNYDIYEGKIEIKATVKRAKDDTTPLDIAVQVSACDENKCLLPSTVKIKPESK